MAHRTSSPPLKSRADGWTFNAKPFRSTGYSQLLIFRNQAHGWHAASKNHGDFRWRGEVADLWNVSQQATSKSTLGKKTRRQKGSKCETSSLAGRSENSGELAAHEKENTNFRVRSETRRDVAGFIAQHGGISELANPRSCGAIL
jgi:hypothetical protein